ncbi:MAG: filamentous hemagglutinin N-terminal domain-containing protein, partial [Rhodoferax sp.]|uniref:two-partner secretion domain-containing protein n=1 Tax=Rhodoferax sp. TaxID=50421 RepID=UPI00260E5282
MSSHASLNHIYRTVWNQALGVMVAVAEIVSGRGRGSATASRRQPSLAAPPQSTTFLTALSLGIAIAWGCIPSSALANPGGGVAIVGQASLLNQGNKLTVTTQNGAGGNYSAINWQSFSIPSGSTTYFQQPNASSTSINRVVTNTPSLLFGTLGSNGKLVLVNQSGIAVGAGAVVDTAGFTASSLRMSDADALAGRLLFGDGLASGAAVSVQGKILARSGDVVLLGSAVETGKQALIEAPNGNTILAAGQQIEITGRGLEGISMKVQAPGDQAVNLGTLKGDAVAIFAGTLKHSGLIQATTASLEGGKVVLKAAGDAYVEGSGKIVASGSVGGSVDVLGQRVALTDQAQIDVSGEKGGGTVRVGGDYQGKNPDVQNASMSYFGQQTSIKADATGSGDGGKVIVWADDTTRAYGSISATGGATGGNGGLVETSGKRALEVAGIRVDASARQGNRGLWLLDPSDITVTHGAAGAFVDGAGLFNPTTSPSSIGDSEISAPLNSGTDVTLQTSGGITGTGTGAIVVNGSADSGGAAVITHNIGLGARTLTLSTLGTINIHSGANINGLGGIYTLNVALNGSSGNTIAGTIDNKGGTTTLTGATTLSSSGTIKNGTLTSVATLTSSNGTLDGVTLSGTLGFGGSGNTFINNGITLAGGAVVNKGASNWFFGSAGTQHIASRGTGTINNAGGTLYAGYGVLSQTLQIDSGITYQGYGSLTDSSAASIINAGTISSNTAAQTLTLSPTNFTNSATGVINAAAGTLAINASSATAPSWSNANTSGLQVGASGTLNLGGSFVTSSLGTIAHATGGVVNITGTLDNTGSTLNLDGTGQFGTGGLTTLTGTIKNGTLSSTTATLTSSGGTLDGVTLSGTLGFGGSGNTFINNGITLASGAVVNKGASNWFFGSAGTQHIASRGTGTINNAGGTLYAGYGVLSQTLQIDSGITYQGYGSLTDSSAASIINAGTISSNTAAQTLTLSPTNFTNSATGVINAAAGTLAINASGATAPSWSNANTSGLQVGASGTLNLGGSFVTASLGTIAHAIGGVVNITGTLDNTGSTLNLDGTGQFGTGGLTTLTGTIKNGTLSSTTATLTSSGGTLDGVTLSGTLGFGGSGNTFINNGITLASG